MAQQFGVSYSAVGRHKSKCLPATLARATEVARSRKPTPKRAAPPPPAPELVALEAKRDDEALDVMTELRRVFVRMNKLMDACDEWLTDPDDSGRYNLSPRAREVTVVYEELVDGAKGRERVVSRKADLQELLDRAASQTGAGITLVSTSTADPRDLIRKTAATIKPQIELLAKLIGQLDERPQVNFLAMPEWLALRAVIVKALRPHPDATAAVLGELGRLRAVDGG